MNIIICGAGEVGSHAAEVLATSGTSITIIDVDANRLRAIEDRLDVATYVGNCARADVLAAGGCSSADLLLAATDRDEVNILSASMAKGLGTRTTIARVHHAEYFEQRAFDYLDHLRIDRMICPEYSTALAIARTLRNPGALAIEDFARGAIEMQEFPVSRKASAIGRSLPDLGLPSGARLAAITRKGGSFIPDASSTIEEGDVVILVGNSAIFQDARKLFHGEKSGRKSIVIMGGQPMSVWLARALRDRDFTVRLFETDRGRAEVLAEKLPWVTILHADPTDPSIFEEENLAHADAFLALLDDDEQNILGCAWAKSMGIPFVVAVVQRSHYLHLLRHVGIDRPFSPRQVAVKEIENIVDESPLRLTASLAEGIIDVYRVRVGPTAQVLGRPLKQIKLSPNWIVAAIQREGTVRVPQADDTISAGDTLLVVGRRGRESALRKIFVTG
ncbi:MAG: Trk system potassium transporter TrkA [Phycisphaerales bacterium]|nr:Trk system potassium transporter TrkA [Phycisphaerae bacterium]NNF44839.1 Trk system potassium transporter TrkA [Phycisphaerales bacterium]NNM24436.1 Trk system potassium transporter TrkA [Phycisphaerales bacterium]